MEKMRVRQQQLPFDPRNQLQTYVLISLCQREPTLMKQLLRELREVKGSMMQGLLAMIRREGEKLRGRRSRGAWRRR